MRHAANSWTFGLFFALNVFLSQTALGGCVPIEDSLANLTSVNDPWDIKNFSDPAKAPERYKYIVTALLDSERAKARIASTKIGENLPIIFASVVTPEKYRTFYDMGLILKIKPEHVIAASPVDTGFDFSDRKNPIAPGPELDHRIATYKRQYGRPPPDKLLAETSPKNAAIWNNEVVLHGKDSNGTPVEIAGIFVWTDRNGAFPYNEIWDRRLYPELVAFAERNKLPIIKFRSQFSRPNDLNIGIERHLETQQLLRIVRQHGYRKYILNFELPDNENFYQSEVIDQNTILSTSASCLEWKKEPIVVFLRSELRHNPTLRLELEALRTSLENHCKSKCLEFFDAVLNPE